MKQELCKVSLYGYTFRIKAANDLYIVTIAHKGERVPIQNHITKSLESAYEFYERKICAVLAACRPNSINE